MIITLADWQFEVDQEATAEYTYRCSQDHCTCAYCRNFYETVDEAHPRLRSVLDKFGILLNGPCEVMPFEPTLVMACYRVIGRIRQVGKTRLYVDDVPLRPSVADENSFFLWAGEMDLPWQQEEDMDDVISPANQPEFMERMYHQWLQTRDESDIS